MKMKKLIIILVLSSLSILCYSQIHKVFRNDLEDTITNTSYSGINQNKYNYYYSVPLTDFIVDLPDGIWIVYDVERKDSSKKDVDEHIKLIGQFKNSLRNGTFRYYSRCNNKKGYRKTETTTYNFKKGELDGYYVSKSCENEKQSEGFYRAGKKDGYFIRYSGEGKIEAIGLYKNDTLCEWSNYYKNGLIDSKGKGEGKFANGEVNYFDTLGNNNRKELYQNGRLLWYKEFYSNGVLQKTADGEFGLCYTIGDAHDKNKCLTYPTTGNIIYYNEKGKELKKEIYQNNKLIDTKTQ